MKLNKVHYQAYVIQAQYLAAVIVIVKINLFD